MKTPKIWIIDIINASDTIVRLLEGYNFEKFKLDEKTNLAIIKLIENIGEACKHLVQEFQQDNPNMPWRKIIAMRNRLIHAYWDIDYEIIWKTATEDAQILKKDLQPILTDLEKKEKV